MICSSEAFKQETAECTCALHAGSCQVLGRLMLCSVTRSSKQILALSQSHVCADAGCLELAFEGKADTCIRSALTLLIPVRARVEVTVADCSVVGRVLDQVPGLALGTFCQRLQIGVLRAGELEHTASSPPAVAVMNVKIRRVAICRHCAPKSWQFDALTPQSWRSAVCMLPSQGSQYGHIRCGISLTMAFLWLPL